MSKTNQTDTGKNSKKGSPTKTKTQDKSHPPKEPMECHICECPLFEPRPTCYFCKKGACSDHLRKLRKYPHKSSQTGDKKKLEGKPNMQSICDECQDEYLIKKAMELPEFTEELKVIQETEAGLEKTAQESNHKSEQVKGRLQAKELKLSTLSTHGHSTIDVGAKVQQLNEVQAKIIDDELELDQHTKLIQAAAQELDVLEAEPFMSFGQDISILQTESGRLTKQLLKLDKNLADLQQGIKKIETEMLQSYQKWERSQKELNFRKNAENGKNCVLF